MLEPARFSQPTFRQRHLLTVPKGYRVIPMIQGHERKSSLMSELLLTGSGMIMFVPLLLVLIVALTGLTAFR
jgi:hypothetical protein